MFENFEINHLFEGQAHERPHFSLKIQGDEYKGMVHNGKIHWYHPHPQQSISDEHLMEIESKVFHMMSNRLQ